MRGAWVEACLTVAMGGGPRRGTEVPTNWVEYGPKNRGDNILTHHVHKYKHVDIKTNEPLTL